MNHLHPAMSAALAAFAPKMPSAREEAVANAEAHLGNAGLPGYKEVLDALGQCLAYIEHKVANEGKSTTDEEWERNVAQFRATVGTLSIGRSYTPKAQVDLAAVRAILSKTAGVTQ